MSHLGLVRRAFSRLLLAVTTAAVALGATVAPAGATPSDAPSVDQPPLSMWVWSRGDPGELVDLAVDQEVERLYVYVYRPSGPELERLRELSVLAGAADIELWAMSGDPHWALQHKKVLAWQRSALATGLFVGTHLDVEPYALDQWETDEQRVIARFLAMLRKLQKRDSRPLAVDVPYWYGNYEAPGRGTLADAVLKIADSVTVMSYHDTATGPNSLSVVAEDMLRRAAAAGVPIELAVETNKLGCKHCTFYEEGADALRDVLDEMHTLLADHPTYTGFAVHDYDGFRALLER